MRKTMKDRAAKGIGKKNLAVSLIMLVICYLIAIACMVMMIVVNDPGDWDEFFYTRSLRFLQASVFFLLLFPILFYYF